MRWKLPNTFNKSILLCGGLMLLAFAACKMKLLPRQMGDKSYGVDITWHGHSCFTLKDNLGRTVVIDPFDETVGYGRISLKADALLMTHNHFDHNFRKAVHIRQKEMEILESSGTATIAAGMEVLGIPSSHDKEKGAIDGPNLIYVFAMGGMRIAHLGDLGQESLTEYQKVLLGQIDILFIPVGGVRTLDAGLAKKIVDEIKPRAVFPMHYGDIRFYKLNQAEDFTRLFPKEQIHVLRESTVRIKAEDLTAQPVIYLLNPTTRNN